MKRMFSEEEIQKIAEAAGGGVTPDDVKAILDDSLEYDDTTKGLVNNVIAEYLENNPPAKYVHNIRFSRSPNYFLNVAIVTSDGDKFTKESFMNFMNSLENGTQLMATGYLSSGPTSVYAISNGSTTQFIALSLGGGSQSYLYSDITTFADNVYQA